MGDLLYRLLRFFKGGRVHLLFVEWVCAVDSHSPPSFVMIHLRHSKRDVFGVGAHIFLGRVDGPICPVKSLLSYLAVRGSTPGTLFLFQDGSPLSRTRLVEAVRSTLSAQGLDVRRFNGQFQDWCGNHSCSLWFGGLIDSDSWSLEVICLYEVHSYPTKYLGCSSPCSPLMRMLFV